MQGEGQRVLAKLGIPGCWLPSKKDLRPQGTLNATFVWQCCLISAIF